MKSIKLAWAPTLSLLTVLAIPARLAGQDNQAHHKHHRYKLVVLGTLGGLQSFGDPGHGAANINNRGVAAGVADTTTPDPNFPNFNPLMNAFGPEPFVAHVFQWKDSALMDLGALPGANSTAASFITENGLVSGESLNGTIDPITGWPEENAVLWKDGQVINLGTLGGYESGAGVVNSRGQVTGFAQNAIPDPFSIVDFLFTGFTFQNGTQTRAFLWDDSDGMQDLGTLGGPDAFAPFINERGQVAGLSYTNSTPNPTTGIPTTDPFLWHHGKMIDLGTLGGTSGGPGGLNNRGQVAGTSNLAGDLIFHPFLWTAPGPMRDLGTLGGSTGVANAINDAGEVVGQADTPTSSHAFLYRHGKMTDLGTVVGHCGSNAFGINSKTQVVGQSFPCDGTGSHAFLWQNGRMIDLNVFVPPSSGLTLGDVEKINDRGEMFGSATLPNGDTRAFLLIPCDENHGDSECEDEGEGTTVGRGETSQRPNVVLPENVRKMLRQRLRFGRFGAQLMRPQ